VETHFGAGAEESIQMSYSGWDRIEQNTPVSDRSLDLEYQIHFHLGDRHDFVAGLGYRRDTGTLEGTDWIWFTPPTRTDDLAGGFLQDEIALGPAVRLTIGSKFEHNSYTGFEFEPTVRLSWAASSRSTFWVSANRAITQPSQYETSIAAIIGSVPVDATHSAPIWFYGNPRLRAEEFRDGEFGYRNQFARNVSGDLATFVGSYHRLVALNALPVNVTQQPGAVGAGLSTMVANANKAFTYGGELSVNWDVNQRWRLSGSYSLYQISSVDTTPSFLHANMLSSDPKHAVATHSRLDLPGKLGFDQWIWWTSELATNQIPSHTRVDARLARPLGESAEISITGQNLTRPRFLEFGDSYGFAGTANPRSVFGQLRWFF
jgi:iron complex outermembrane recepter protein